MSFIVIIPARFGSSRFPGKPLVDINGKPMVVRVMEKAIASGADRVIVATDHLKVLETVKNAGGEACMTRDDHQSGTERLAEVITFFNIKNREIVINMQGDEPFISPDLVSQVAENLSKSKAVIATLATPIVEEADVNDPHIVKVIIDAYSYAIYFSRATIPWSSDSFFYNSKYTTRNKFLRHIGIYAYHAEFILRYTALPPSPIEKIESLEQLRALWYGEKIHVALASKVPGIGIDTPEQFEKIRTLYR